MEQPGAVGRMDASHTPYGCAVLRDDETTQQEAVSRPAERASLQSQGAGTSPVQRKDAERRLRLLRGKVTAFRRVEELVSKCPQ